MKNLGEASSITEIRSRLAALTAADTRRWGTLTVEEMLAHVRGAYRGATEGPIRPLMKSPLPPKLMRFFALNVPMQWPKTIPTVPELRREALPVPGTFAEELEAAKDSFERFIAVADNRRTHPIFAAMTPWHWLRWGYLHADHHLRQFGR